MRNWTRVLTMVLTISAWGCADAAESGTQPATNQRARSAQAVPATVQAVLDAAQPGDTITLGPGDYGDVILPRRDNIHPVRILAGPARLRTLTFRETAGWTWEGGTIDSPLPPDAWAGVTIEAARRITLRGATITGARTGLTIQRQSNDIDLIGNHATGLQSDGFNVASGYNIRFVDNFCDDMRPILPVFDATGKMLQDGTHNDCIQMWSAAGEPPTRDITILGTRARGYMQGIGVYGNPGVPVENVTVRDSDLELSLWHGISLTKVRGADVRNNRVRAVPGAKALHYPFQPIQTWIMIEDDGLRCGNIDYKGKDQPCPPDR